jgi:hypothetical protein
MKGLIAIIQLILHYLAWAGIVFGIIAFMFSNTDRGWTLLIGGVGLMAVKYVIGFVYLGVVKVIAKT